MLKPRKNLIRPMRQLIPPTRRRFLTGAAAAAAPLLLPRKSKAWLPRGNPASTATVSINAGPYKPSVNSYGNFATYNLAAGTGPIGTDGPWWVQMDQWYPNTPPQTGTTTKGSNVITSVSYRGSIDFVDGMTLFIHNTPVRYPTITSVTSNTLTISENANSSGVNTNLVAALIYNSSLTSAYGYFNASMTANPSTFPNGTTLTWTYPPEPNLNNVYGYPSLVYGTSGSYGAPSNKAPPLQISSVSTLAVNYNVNLTATLADTDVLIESFIGAVSNPALFTNSGAMTASISGNVLTVTSISGAGLAVGCTVLGHFGPSPVAVGTYIVNQLTGSAGGTGTYIVSKNQTVSSQKMGYNASSAEVSFFAHCPSYLSGYILSLSQTLPSYSSGGFNAYISRTNNFPQQICIMPVTTPGGTTPLDLISGNVTMPLAGVFQYLVTNGWIAETDYITQFQMGIEPAQGGGSLAFNNISYIWG